MPSSSTRARCICRRTSAVSRFRQFEGGANHFVGQRGQGFLAHLFLPNPISTLRYHTESARRIVHAPHQSLPYLGRCVRPAIGMVGPDQQRAETKIMRGTNQRDFPPAAHRAVAAAVQADSVYLRNDQMSSDQVK